MPAAPWHDAPVIALCAYLLLAIGLLYSDGRSSGLPLALAAAALLAVAVLRGATRPPSRRAAAALIGLCALLGAIRPPGVYLAAAAPRLLLSALGIAVALPSLAGCAWPRLAPRALLAAMLALHVAAGAALIHWSPAPRIDVWTFEQQSAADLLGGRDPYRSTFENPYSAEETRAYYGASRVGRRLDCLPYPPLSVAATTAGWGIGRDVRYSVLAAQVLAALALYALARRRGHAAWLALALAGLLLTHPRGLFVVEQAWTDPLIAAFAVLLLLGLAVPRRWAGIALGLFLAAKQYSVVALPLALSARFVPRRFWPSALAAGALFTLPLALWDLRAFVDDVALCQIRQPFRMDALSLAAPIAAWTGVQAPGALAFLVAAGALAVVWRRLQGGVEGLAQGMAVAYFSFFLTAKQAFCNYYYFVGVLLLAVAATAAPAAEAPSDAARKERRETTSLLVSSK